MHLWEFIGICSIVFIVLEIFIPSLFFLNFAVAAFITALLSVFVKTPYILVLIFFVLSFVSFAFLRPILIKRTGNKKNETGIENKYIGQTAVAETDISKTNGVITIYGERWEARSEDEQLIEKGNNVTIVRNESIVMYVKNFK